jgi:hypothetical protein
MGVRQADHPNIDIYKITEPYGFTILSIDGTGRPASGEIPVVPISPTVCAVRKRTRTSAIIRAIDHRWQ